MPQAPNRGKRKCGTCALYEPMEGLEDGCYLDLCECRAKGKTFGIAMCPHFKPCRYIDHSNHRDIGGPITGTCGWKPPPILRKLLWGEWKYRLVNADGSWCHCWEPMQPVKELTHGAGPRHIHGGAGAGELPRVQGPEKTD